MISHFDRFEPVTAFRHTLLAGLALLLASPACTTAAGEWSMYRGDAARTAYAVDALPTSLTLLWTHVDAHQPRPAWPTSRRMQFDRAIQAVSLGNLVVMGSTIDGSVTALDASSGQIVWRTFTDGPIRFAPALWRDRAFVASDDGHLHALRLSDGKLLWKHRGGPSHATVLGNERLISKWPMRGGPVVALDGTDATAKCIVYCAAGIWPSEGIHLFALDALTGDIIWKNSDAGSIYMPQPHGGAQAKSGVAAQGYLAVSGDQLFVPTGRAVPAVFNRHTGKLEYFHLQKYGHNGDSLAMVIGDTLFNGGVGFDIRSGTRAVAPGSGHLAAAKDGIVRASNGAIVGYEWRDTEKPDRKGKPIKVRTLSAVWNVDTGEPAASILTTGEQVVIGGSDKVLLFDPRQEKVVWKASVDGVAYGLATAHNRLLVSTDQGALYCFAAATDAANDTGPTAHAPRPANWSSGWEVRADAIIHRTGVKRGWCLDIGCGDGSLARELALKTELHVIAIDSDPDRVRAARENLLADRLLGDRVTVLQRDLADTALPRYFADLIVSSNSYDHPLSTSVRKEADRLLRPYGGQLCWTAEHELSVSERGPLEKSGAWTHQYADPANTVNSGDARLGGRLSVLWFRDLDFAIPSRHGRAPAPLVSEGRIFHEGMNGLVAVDAYNGRELWRYDIPGVLKAYDGDELMGVAGTGSNFCVGGDSIYIRDGDRCLRLDAKSGSLIGEFVTPLPADSTTKQHPQWGYIAWVDGVLYGTAANSEHIVTYRYLNRGGDMTRLLTESTSLFAFDTASGKTLWQYHAKDSIRHNTIAISEGNVYLIDRPLALFDRTKKPTTTDHATGTLVALNARSGERLWENDDDIYGTMLAVSAEHKVLLMSYQPTRFRLDSEKGGRLTGLNTESGERLWEIDAQYSSRPTLNDRTLFVQGGAWDLLTGARVPFEFKRSYGCGILASSKNMLLYRSATLGYRDLSKPAENVDYGGIRPGCWINVIPAGGLVLMPDATSGCECSYLNKAWIALEPEGK